MELLWNWFQNVARVTQTQAERSHDMASVDCTAGIICCTRVHLVVRNEAEMTNKNLEYIRLAMKEGIAVSERDLPTPRKQSGWAICIDSMDGRYVGRVQVMLPRWISTIFLWWVLPEAAWHTIRKATAKRGGQP